MIKIKTSETADTRTCDFANVTKEKLLAFKNTVELLKSQVVVEP